VKLKLGSDGRSGLKLGYQSFQLPLWGHHSGIQSMTNKMQ